MAEWLYKCEKTLNFFFNNDPEDLSEEEALEAAGGLAGPAVKKRKL